MRSNPPGQPNQQLSWLLVTDVDDTLLGSDQALAEFDEIVKRSPDFGYVLNSSRPLPSIEKTLSTLSVPIRPSGMVTALGTEVRLGGCPENEWASRFEGWDRAVIDELMLKLGAIPHADEYQTPFKASYAVPPELQSSAREAIDESGIGAQIVASGASDFDVLPGAAGKAAAFDFLISAFQLPNENLIVAGDSGNDLEMFENAPKGIVVGNAREELKSKVDPDKAYFAESFHAAGIIEGLRHWQVPLNELPQNL